MSLLEDFDSRVFDSIMLCQTHAEEAMNALPSGEVGTLRGIKVVTSKNVPDDSILLGRDPSSGQATIMVSPLTASLIQTDQDYASALGQLADREIKKMGANLPHLNVPPGQPATINGGLAALNASLEASSAMHDERLGRMERESKIAATIGGWELRLTDLLDHLEFYVDNRAERTYISTATYETLCASQAALELFYEDMTQGAGMKRLVTDAGKYREAALAEAAAKGLDKPARGSDLLASIEADANALIIQAGSLNSKPTPLQLQIFAERLAGLNDDIAKVEERLERLRSLASLAGLAVADATE